MIGMRTMPRHRSHQKDRDRQQEERKNCEQACSPSTPMPVSECCANIKSRSEMHVIPVTNMQLT